MIRKLLPVFLTLIAATACGECSIKEGSYESAGGSEQQIHLKLLQNNKFILQHETWEPGHYGKRERSEVNGSWVCNKKQLVLNINNANYRAEQVIVGKNPLGISINTNMLHFDKNMENEYGYLANEILYPHKSVR